MSARGQAATIGVAVLLAVTVVSIAGLTVAVGSVVEERANASEARSVARAMDSALDTERSGHHEGRIALGEGRLRTVERSVRLRDGTDPVAAWSVDGLVYAAGPHRVRYVAGAIVHDTGNGAGLHAAPSVSVSDRTLFVSLPVLGAERAALDGPASVTLRTNVSHSRRHRAVDGVSLAVETETPGVWERRFEAMGATTSRQSVDGDGVPSVVARFPDVEDVYVFRDDLDLEVGR
jgi:hypothetical protein